MDLIPYIRIATHLRINKSHLHLDSINLKSMQMLICIKCQISSIMVIVCKVKNVNKLSQHNLQNILIKLIASKEEVAKAIQNSHKEANSLRDAIAGRSQLSSHYCKRGGGQLCPRLGAGQVATWVRDA